MLRPALALLVVLALALSACVAAGDPEPLPGEAQAPVDPDATAGPAVAGAIAPPDRIEEECPAILELLTQCGLLIVPEDRTDPAGPVVEVAWSVLPPRGGDSDGRRPLLILPDGPGMSGLDEAVGALGSDLRTQRRLIVLDPRGTGSSFPSLDCGQPPRPGVLPLDLVEECRAALTAQGIELAAYGTRQIALDVVDIIRTLGVGPVDVLGVGHGAEVALDVMRLDPGLVRAAVLDSPTPHDADVLGEAPATASAALNRVLDACAESPSCPGGADLQRQVEDLVAALDADPVELAPGEQLTGRDLVSAALAALRGTEGPAEVPAALATAVAGDPATAVARLRELGNPLPAARRDQLAEEAEDAEEDGPPPVGASEGLALSVLCGEQVPSSSASATPADDLSPVERAVAEEVADLLAACQLWDVPQAPEPEPVEAPAPVLVLVGEFDPAATPARAGAVASQVADAEVVQVAGAGHRVHDADGCTSELVLAFLERPRAPLDAGCATDRPVRFAAQLGGASS